MHFLNFAFTVGMLASMVATAPFNTTTIENHLEVRDGNKFKIHVWNNCPWTKQVAIYGVTADFQMVAHSKPTNIKPGKQHIINAPFKGVGLRLSGHAEWGLDGQWQNQALFEFGYSEYMGQTGTSYDLSLMQPGTDLDIGMGVWPIENGQGSGSCRSFVCFPWYCPPTEGWTNPDQINLGSPADTVCYKGKTDFKVVYCP
jgi:hypothetical protein